jgi:hypothetical protein
MSKKMDKKTGKKSCIGKKIYGIDLSGKVTPAMVRDAIIECFVRAHSEVLEMMKEYHKFESDEQFQQMKQLDVKILIKSKFDEIGADFDRPTKEDLAKVIDRLADFASNFRKPEIIKKHYNEIKQLIELL